MIGFSMILHSVLLGIALAMDAFSVSAVNGLAEPHMRKTKAAGIAGTFALFQIVMPLIGWFCVHTIAEAFAAVQPFIPWAAFLLLLYIGGKMIIDAFRRKEAEEQPTVGFWGLILQGIATSIDALSVGFTIAELSFPEAMIEALIIGAVTFLICIGGVVIGKVFGTKFSGKAYVIGGCILIAIGLKILFEHLGWLPF